MKHHPCGSGLIDCSNLDPMHFLWQSLDPVVARHLHRVSVWAVADGGDCMVAVHVAGVGRTVGRRMIPVMQRSDSDCLRCCLASIFEVDYDDAPDTTPESSSESQHNRVNRWLEERGLVEWGLDDSANPPVLRRGTLDGKPNDRQWPYPLATHYIGCGPSPRNEDYHCVVMRLGRIVHDPHPDQNMTIDRIKHIYVYLARLP